MDPVIDPAKQYIPHTPTDPADVKRASALRKKYVAVLQKTHKKCAGCGLYYPKRIHPDHVQRCLPNR